MKKRNFHALALSALLLGMVVAAPAYADEDEQTDETELMLAGGACGGGKGGSCGSHQQEPTTPAQPTANPGTPAAPTQPQDIKKKNGGSCAANTKPAGGNGGSCSHILAGCGCGKDSNNDGKRHNLLA